MEQTHIGGGMKLRVVPSALSLILTGKCIPAKSGGSGAQCQEHAFLLTQLVSAPRIYRPPA
jgi:hypothetical protein